MLFTFAAEGHPKETPLYAHEDLSGTFTGIEELLRRLLETVIPTRCTPIPLERTRDSLYTGRVPDERMLELAQFYLAVMANVPEDKVVKEVPLKAKVSSLDRVELMVESGLWEIPSGDPAQPGTVAPPGVELIARRLDTGPVPAWAPRGLDPVTAFGAAGPGARVAWLGL